jgi:uncharacterized protein YbbK (DUF523 family)
MLLAIHYMSLKTIKCANINPDSIEPDTIKPDSIKPDSIKIKIGISSCLLGNKVRYDGQHQYNAEIINTLDNNFELVPFCPEMEIGLGVPRAKIQLVERNDSILCLDEATHLTDYTAQLSQCCDHQVSLLNQTSGYIFKTKSPSCGLTKVKTDYQGEIKANGQGIFAKRLLELFPDMPVIEEDQFASPELRNGFIIAVKKYSKRNQSDHL